MSINLPKLTEDLNIIQSLDDQPTLTSSELKGRFDEAGNNIKDYINNILIKGISDALEVIDGFGDTIEEKMKTKFENIYHIGKVITTSEDINPSTYLGFGTWELIGKGKVLIGVDPNNAKFNQGGKTGGNESVKLSTANLPSFNLSNVVTNVSANTSNTADLSFVQGPVVTGINVYKGNVGFTNNNQKAIDITPMYETVYRYKRIA